jgi:sarcosine oxidase subunit alpha
MMYRLAAHSEEWLNRAATLRFTFEGRDFQGYEGDTITSALAAAGVNFLARSFKYHRPRGILSFANHDSNTLFQVDGVPNVRGDITLLRAGMSVSAQNTFGGLERDKARALDGFAKVLPVGFYYKAFHSKRLFPRWERMFRALTGLGQVSPGAPRQTTPKRYGFCDVLVIGAGLAGLSAARAAAAAGAQVVLVDESLRLSGHGSAAESVGALRESPSITVLTATVAAGYYADHWVALASPDRLTKMRAKAVVFATGAIEQPAVFRNNDLPGVLLASAAARLLARYGVAPGRRVAVVAANLDAYRICLEMHARGVMIAAIVEWRSAPEIDPAVADCVRLGLPVLKAHAPYAAVRGSDGNVAGLDVVPVDASGDAPLDASDNAAIDAGRAQRIDCDAILMSVGWAGATQLLLQAGCSTVFSEELQQFVPDVLPAGIFAAGRVNGVYDPDARLADGARAGALAAAHAGFGTASVAAVARAARCPSHRFPIVDHPRGKNFVDFDEDLQVKDLENAASEGFDSSELLKRYSTVGMGPSQGKHSNMNALRVLARWRGAGVDALGLTTARPMYHPVPLKLLAGRSFNPERRTPVDAEHARLGAVWMPAGNWRRPEYYAVPGETRTQSIDAEVHAVRSAVGIIDVGTLGKIEVHGPDSGEFLDRAYAGKYSDLKVGMTRYGLMLDESGVIVDDGVIARLNENLFYFTTTTGGSATVYRELLRLNALWGLDCALVNLTGHRAAFNFAGPSSRDILQRLTDIDLGEYAFPYLGVRSGQVAGNAARLLRVGFVGELGYEIHVAAGHAVEVWRALCAAGAPRGLRPFGVEAQRVLRLEKGHFIVGQDTDGLTDPDEANAMWAVAMKKPFFVGQRSLRILKARGPRQKLMGIELIDATRLPKECHLVIDEGEIAGRVTSVAHSRALNKSIGLAMLSPALAQVGRNIQIRIENGALVAARVAGAPFYDPKNLRQKAGAAA